MQIVGRPANFDMQDGRRARSASGFGCIRCGCTVYRYCSLDSEEGPDGLFLLCVPCKDMLNGFAERESVIAVLRRSPVPAQRGFYRDLLPYMRGYEMPDVRFATGAWMRQTPMPILLDNHPLLHISPPETYAGPAQFGITLGAGDGLPVMAVRANEWVADDRAWRFERRGSRYAVRSLDGVAVLEISFAPDKTVTIERLASRLGGHRLELDATGARLDGEPVEIPNVDSRVIGISL